MEDEWARGVGREGRKEGSRSEREKRRKNLGALAAIDVTWKSNTLC